LEQSVEEAHAGAVLEDVFPHPSSAHGLEGRVLMAGRKLRHGHGHSAFLLAQKKKKKKKKKKEEGRRKKKEEEEEVEEEEGNRG
jgi:hypothetical protein